VASFLVVELTLLSKLLLRMASILAVRFDTDQELAYYLTTHRGESAVVCTYDLAFPIGVTSFTVALTLNAV